MATKTNGIGSILKILVVAAIAFILLNIFGLAPSCALRFGCGGPSWLPQAHADSGSCPDGLKRAATDAGWAADRIATIEKERRTTLLGYDEDGTEHRFESGEDSDETTIIKILEEMKYPPGRDGRYAAASHAEAKLALWMRESGVTYVVAVINNRRGVCADTPQSCTAIVGALLPKGATLDVWEPGRSAPRKMTGG